MRVVILASLMGCVLFAAFHPEQVLAAPVPKEDRQARMKKLLGELIDPGQDCKLTFEGDNIHVDTSDKLNAPATTLKNAPRTSRVISGDFVLTVTVSYSSRKDPLGDQAGGHLGAGLAAWSNETDFIIMNRHHWPHAGAKNGSNWSGGFDIHGEGGNGHVSHGATCDEVAPDKPTQLKLTRKGNTFLTEESRDDGKTWNRLTESQHEFPKELKVGLIVHNTTSGKARMTFSQYSLTQVIAK
jgi:regulation of enolase protein 1 (concanavalin A-like superfamily)